jgi:hypothetical protein
MRKIDRVKKRFVEDGFDAALSRKKPDRTYDKKNDKKTVAILRRSSLR